MSAVMDSNRGGRRDFITGEETIRRHPFCSVVEHRCDFWPGNYADSLYPALAVDFPASLSRSVDKRKAEFLAGRRCARQALISLGREPVTVATGRRGDPLWPLGITGSISHCRTMATAVVSDDPAIRGLGVDMEPVIDEGTIHRTRDRVLVAEELPLLEKGIFSLRMIFTLIFSTKESFYKAASPTVGDYFDFDAVTVTGIDPATSTVSFRLNYRLHPSLPRGACFEARFTLLKADIVSTLVWL